jgi:molybdate transport system regulatory protein
MPLDIVKIKTQLRCGPEFAMGPGKAALLEAIDQAQSISGAGRLLGMSYRRTWLLVDSMNRCWQEKLVETLAGGGKERGARLSDMGRRVLGAYRTMEADIARAAQGDPLAQLQAMLRDEPLPSQHVATAQKSISADG